MLNIEKNLAHNSTDKIIGLPRSVFYSILINDKLTIESEDSLLDLIEKFMNNNEMPKSDISSESRLSDVDFYEMVNFEFLSEDKLKEFIEKVDPNVMKSRCNSLKKIGVNFRKTNFLRIKSP